MLIGSVLVLGWATLLLLKLPISYECFLQMRNAISSKLLKIVVHCPSRLQKIHMTWQVIRKRQLFRDSYTKVDGREDCNGPEAAEIRICKEGANKRSNVASSTPVCDIVGCSSISLMQILSQIRYQIGTNSIVCKTLTTFISCQKEKSATSSETKHCAHGKIKWISEK